MSGSITLFAANTVFLVLPGLLVSPLAGLVADKWDKKKIMVITDLGAMVTNIGLVTLHSSGHLQVWHVFAASTRFYWRL
jgi:Na+/melibiose symporter-like transporter